MDELLFAPLTGPADADTLFASTNPFRITMLVSDAPIIGGVEINSKAKSPMDLRLTIDGSVHQVPIEVASRIKSKNGGIVRWMTTETGNSGSFMYFRAAPAVFEDDELVRKKA